jgi:hypothetical protein
MSSNVYTYSKLSSELVSSLDSCSSSVNIEILPCLSESDSASWVAEVARLQILQMNKLSYRDCLCRQLYLYNM